MKQSYQIAESLAGKIVLNKVFITLPEYAPGSIDHWRIDTEKVKAEINTILSEEQQYLMNYDLFEEIVEELYCRLRHRLFSAGITN